MPYQVRGARSGAAALTSAWRRSAIARSPASISAIFPSTSLSASAPFWLRLSSRLRSRIAARSSAVNPSAFFVFFWVGWVLGMSQPLNITMNRRAEDDRAHAHALCAAQRARGSRRSQSEGAQRRHGDRSERAQLKTLLRRALVSAPQQPPWRGDEET